MKRIVLGLTVAVVGVLAGCSTEKVDVPEQRREPVASAVPIRTAHVVATYPHDERAFTQGLQFHQGQLLESVGLNGSSALRLVDLVTGKELRRVPLGDEYFAEGLALVGDRIYQLTWLNQRCFIYDAYSFKRIDSTPYLGEGWGLTTDGTLLYMSNGTNMITVRNPNDFSILRVISVTQHGSAQSSLNELEWINGRIWANVWKTDSFVCINPETGVVEEVVDLSSVYPLANRPPTADVMNGIAYDSTTSAIYVTGKHWPYLFQVEVR